MTIKQKAIKAKRICWYPLRNWNAYEQVLFWLNVVVATAFLIYGYVHPDFIKKDDNAMAYVINSVSYVANIANITSILISTQKKIINFIFGAIACSSLGLIAFLNGATGSWILYWIIQFPLQFIGFYLWRKSSKDKVIIKPTQIKWQIAFVFAAGMVGLIMLWSWLNSMKSFQEVWYGKPIEHQSWAVYISDAIIFIVGLFASIMALFRYREQWILWIILDIFCITLWSIMLNVQLLITSITALLNAVYGIYAWWKK